MKFGLTLFYFFFYNGISLPLPDMENYAFKGDSVLSHLLAVLLGMPV